MLLRTINYAHEVRRHVLLLHHLVNTEFIFIFLSFEKKKKNVKLLERIESE